MRKKVKPKKEMLLGIRDFQKRTCEGKTIWNDGMSIKKGKSAQNEKKRKFKLIHRVTSLPMFLLR